MMLNLKTKLQSMYLVRRYETLIRYINAYYPLFVCREENGCPCVDFNGKVFIGFDNAETDESIYQLIRDQLPGGLDGRFYRIARDIITRYIYPHMMPCFKPLNRGYKTLSGFHGQHKDAVADIEDVVLRDELYDVFTPRHDDVVLNCGAFTGYGDMRLSEYLPHGKIYAIEAKAECFVALSENLSVNRVANVVPLNHAVWHKNETIDLNTGELQANSLVSDKSFYPESYKLSCELVQAVTLDSLAEKFSLKKVDFISLTLNGAEVEAIDGMVAVLSGFAPRIRLAGWYFRGKDPVANLCAEKLRKHGYKVVIGKYRSVYAYKRR